VKHARPHLCEASGRELIGGGGSVMRPAARTHGAVGCPPRGRPFHPPHGVDENGLAGFRGPCLHVAIGSRSVHGSADKPAGLRPSGGLEETVSTTKGPGPPRSARFRFPRSAPLRGSPLSTALGRQTPPSSPDRRLGRDRGSDPLSHKELADHVPLPSPAKRMDGRRAREPAGGLLTGGRYSGAWVLRETRDYRRTGIVPRHTTCRTFRPVPMSMRS
jgi:hypothetical protein